MIKKIFNLLKNPKLECEKIVPFFRTKIYFAKIKKAKRNQNKEFNRLKLKYAEYTPLLLHIGCGQRILKDWVNIDLFFNKAKNDGTNKKQFFAFNMMETGLPLPDNSVDAIFHEDFIEHLEQKEQVVFLAETFRVLRPESIHRINTPDLLKSMQTNSDFKNGKSGVYVDEWNKWKHKNILTKNYLKEIALMIGYKNVIFNGRNKSTSNKIPLEYRPETDRPEDGNLFADLIK
jgi:predicted SAM-dependent methyltransferase